MAELQTNTSRKRIVLVVWLQYQMLLQKQRHKEGCTSCTLGIEEQPPRIAQLLQRERLTQEQVRKINWQKARAMNYSSAVCRW